MRSTDFVPYRVAAADDYLAIFQDSHRHQSVLDPEADEDAQLSFDTTVAEWRGACDLVSWRPLARALNRQFAAMIPLAEWRAALEPADRRTLRDVSALLARHARLPTIVPYPIAGAKCASAGAFLTFRSLLRRSGAPVIDLRPYSPLEPLLDRHAWAVLDAAGQLAPGTLPRASVVQSATERRECIAQIAMLLVSYGVLAFVPGWRLYGALLLCLSMLWGLRRRRWGRVHVPGVTTIRDLVSRLLSPRAPAV
jgi:hypothetical protein